MGGTIVSESVQSLTDVDELINAGKFREAETALRDLQDRDRFMSNPHFWFKVLLVSSLLGRPERDIEELHERVSSHKEWTDEMETDYLRDCALRYITRLGVLHPSRRQVAAVTRTLDSAVRRVCADPNREASITAARARLLIAQKQFKEAASHCSYANAQWEAVGDLADQQWIRNNTFHWFIAVRRQVSTKYLLWSGMTVEGRDMEMIRHAERLLRLVIDNPDERNKSRKMMALVIFYTGRLGHLAYRLVAKYRR